MAVLKNINIVDTGFLQLSARTTAQSSMNQNAQIQYNTNLRQRIELNYLTKYN
jgi:hypothetical protein